MRDQDTPLEYDESILQPIREKGPIHTSEQFEFYKQYVRDFFSQSSAATKIFDRIRSGELGYSDILSLVDSVERPHAQDHDSGLHMRLPRQGRSLKDVLKQIVFFEDTKLYIDKNIGIPRELPRMSESVFFQGLEIVYPGVPTFSVRVKSRVTEILKHRAVYSLPERRYQGPSTKLVARKSR